jgi:hypothetical protein
MTKQMQKDFRFLKDTQKMLVSYWGKKGPEIFSQMQQRVDEELAPLYEQSLEQVTGYMMEYFKEHAWHDEKISRWLEGESSPFRKGLKLKDEDLARLLVAEFSLIKLGDVLVTFGLPKQAVETLATAIFIAHRNRSDQD